MNRRKKETRTVRGISLVELMIAVSVIAVGAMALMAQLEASHKITTVNRETNKAVAHMQAMMEKVISVPFSDIVRTYPNGTIVYAGQSGLGDPMDGEYFRIEYADAAADPLQITVTVYWTSFDGRMRTRSLTTMRTR